MDEYVTWEWIDVRGVVHLCDEDYAGFPLCGANQLSAREETERGPLCCWCREAAGRERRARRLFPAAS